METVTYNWLVLIYYLPPEAGSTRVRVWRKMKKLGMVSFRNSAYFLPYSDEHYEIIQWLCQEIQKAGGEATLLKTKRVENLSNEEVAGFFQKARGEEYGQLTEIVEDLYARLEMLVSAPGKDGADLAPAEMTALVDELKGIEKHLSEIREIDFFDAPGGRQAEEAVSRCRRSLRRLQKEEGPPQDSAGQLPILDPAKFQGKTWVTRPKPYVDRIATAWAIRRFVDPRARFVFAGNPKKAANAIPYDYVDAELSHVGEDCTFETLLHRFGLHDRWLAAIGEIVHDIDLKDGKFNRREAAGVEMVLKGLAAASNDDHILLEQGFLLFNHLYSGLRAGRAPQMDAAEDKKATKKRTVHKSSAATRSKK